MKLERKFRYYVWDSTENQFIISGEKSVKWKYGEFKMVNNSTIGGIKREF